MFKEQTKIQETKLETVQSEMKNLVNTLKHEHSVLKLQHETFVQETEKKTKQ